ncbi:hypothetical protein HZA97_09450 [Candidatus Woesearchaeota archaeon]|nr:hypothetical protein [Candidatus Woesearchaeota archaeon]
MKRGVLLLSTVLALTSCKSEPVVTLDDLVVEEIVKEDNFIDEDSPAVKQAKHWQALTKYEPLTPENKFNPDGTEKAPFNLLEGDLEEHINRIYLITREDFYHDKNWTIAHAHSELGIICLPLNYEKSTVFHEAAHVRHAYLDETTNFSMEWREVARIRYGSLADITDYSVLWHDGTNVPKFGCLDAYNSTSIYEDVANFVGVLGYQETPEQIKGFLDYNANIKDFFIMYPFYFCDKNDRRYQEKIDLLYEYHFLNFDQYSTLTRNLGCLRELWVEDK